MSWMFDSATKFNQPLSSWNVISVTNMYAMFYLTNNSIKIYVRGIITYRIPLMSITCLVIVTVLMMPILSIQPRNPFVRLALAVGVSDSQSVLRDHWSCDSILKR
jgi:surface protein